MENKSLKTLEFDKVLGRLSAFAVSSKGKNYCRNLKPSSDPETVKKLLGQTSDMQEVIVKKGPIPFSSIYDIEKYVEMATIQMVLKIPDLIRISRSLTQAEIGKNYIEKFDGLPSLKVYTKRIEHLDHVINPINKCIISEEELADDASETLRQIRNRKKTLNIKIRKKLEKIVNSSSYSKILQDTIVTTRDGRFVVPVKSEYKGQFPGVVHDSSASGATLFIEPMSVVNMNNEVAELKKKEDVEIERILIELTGIVGQNASQITENMEMVQILDFINAKGLLSAEIEGIEPKLNDKKIIYLRNARHPLIDKETIVPLTLKIGEDFKILVITGPNTGGKTVALKTVGLLTIMAQSGLHIPADYGSDIYVFDKIYADIGDEQSISQSLSTFSSHMTNIVQIVNQATSRTLTIFDELGAGTDPIEGAGLAKAILEYLREKDIMVLSSTHYSELKNYALVTHGVENASMEFDLESLSPTYKIIVGIPGKSNAFEISKKLGLNAEIIEKAKVYIKKSDIQMEDLIEKLQMERKLFEDRNERIAQLEEENKLENQRLKNLVKIQREKHDKKIEEAKHKAKIIVKQAKRQSDSLIKDIKKMKKEASVSDKSLQDLRDRARDLDEKFSREKGVSLKKISSKPLKEVKIGDMVFVPSFQQNAKVIGMEKNDIIVQIGNMTINVKKNNIQKPVQEKKESKVKMSGLSMRDKDISSQIDLRGMDLETALIELDKYIDNASLVGLGKITVIHGMGTYVLKNGVREYLRKHKNVKSYEDDAPSLGGATNVDLK